jgi:hypothetical protein
MCAILVPFGCSSRPHANANARAAWVDAQDPAATQRLARTAVIGPELDPHPAILRRDARGVQDFNVMEAVCTHATGARQMLNEAVRSYGGASFDAGLAVQATIVGRPDPGLPVAVIAANDVAAYVCVDDLDITK